MSDRLQIFLANRDIHGALQNPEVVDILSGVMSLSDYYIPALQFLIRPDNRKKQKQDRYLVLAMHVSHKDACV